MEIKKFGAIIFDNIKNPTSGWASHGENGAPFHFIDQTELPSDVLWWSNCPYDVFHAHGRFASNIRPSSYLNVTTGEILAEWDINDSSVSADIYVRVCGTVFHHLMRIIRGLLKLTCPEKSSSDYFRGPQLAVDAADLLPGCEYPTGDAIDILRPGIAYSHLSYTTLPKDNGLVPMAVRRPRLDHAVRMLSAPAPVGPFVHVAGQDLPPLKDLINLDQPVMAEIIVHHGNPPYAPVFGWNVSASRGIKTQRTWAPHPELAVLASFADIEVRSAYIGTAYSHLSASLPDVVRGLIADGSGALSWSAGVAIDSLWRSATVGKSFQVSARQYRRAHTSWQGAWMRSYDKVEMFKKAMAFHLAGFRVSNYGGGLVRCLLPEERTLEYFLNAYQIGMVPAIVDVKQPVSTNLLRPRTWGGDPETRSLAWKILTRESGDLWMMDRYPIANREDRLAMNERIKAC